MEKHELVIIGGGSAGIAAALGAAENGLKDIVVIERESEYGGILQQCIHNGFGLHTFNEELSGPAYAEKYYSLIKDNKDIQFLYDSAAIEIKDHTVTVQTREGLKKLEGKAIIMSTGCRERPAGAIGMKGNRCEGVYTAGTAQKYLNRKGFLVGKKIFILGSGDIGLIMARRMTLEGAKVIGVAEIMPYSNGLARNMKQCLEDFDIPLYLSHTVEAVHGSSRLESITLIEVDDRLKKIPGSEKQIECDCLLLSVGLIPENKLIEDLGVRLDPKTKGAVVDDRYMTSVDGIFACGNALHVHDLVDYVSIEARKAGKAAAEYVLHGKDETETVRNTVQNGISYMVPQHFHKGNDIEFMFRVNRVFKECSIHVYGKGLDRKFKKLGIVPSEMQKVGLKKEDLEELEGELFWEVCE
ncbi:MAG: FAD-dependent oxidoreductase [Erysipelotrichaceae bacterium]|nr:FAD-dependent oxidoreductase [Erysipelotrichaceae bacterium]MBQ1787314.1 FAD-dependent oxidoreductase [Erysipelotrichaceae bacterium]